MHVVKKLSTLLVSTAAIAGGLAAVASPAMANTCTGAIPIPGSPGSYANVCADARTYDADPGHAGFGVEAAASASLQLSGYSHFCTDYYGAGANVVFGAVPPVQVDTVTGSPGAC